MKWKKKKAISWSFVSTLSMSIVHWVISSVVKGKGGKRVRKAGRGYMKQIA